MLDVLKVWTVIEKWLKNPEKSAEDIALLNLEQVRTYIEVLKLMQEKKTSADINTPKDKLPIQYHKYACLLYGKDFTFAYEPYLRSWLFSFILIELNQHCRALEHLEKNTQETIQLLIAKQLKKLADPSDHSQKDFPPSIEDAETNQILDLFQSRQQLQEQNAELASMLQNIEKQNIQLTNMLQKNEGDQKEQLESLTLTQSQNEKLKVDVSKLQSELDHSKILMKQLKDVHEKPSVINEKAIEKKRFFPTFS